MNHFLYRSTGTNSYATFFYGQLDEESRVLRYVNAGHNPPYLLRGAEIEELTIGGTVIGMFPRMAYEQGEVQLQSGDVLIIFTDGVPEALNPAGEGTDCSLRRGEEDRRVPQGISAQDLSQVSPSYLTSCSIIEEIDLSPFAASRSQGAANAKPQAVDDIGKRECR